jgi:hypothetical protein
MLLGVRVFFKALLTEINLEAGRIQTAIANSNDRSVLKSISEDLVREKNEVTYPAVVASVVDVDRLLAVPTTCHRRFTSLSGRLSDRPIIRRTLVILSSVITIV